MIPLDSRFASSFLASQEAALLQAPSRFPLFGEPPVKKGDWREERKEEKRRGGDRKRSWLLVAGASRYYFYRKTNYGQGLIINSVNLNFFLKL